MNITQRKGIRQREPSRVARLLSARASECVVLHLLVACMSIHASQCALAWPPQLRMSDRHTKRDGDVRAEPEECKRVGQMMTSRLSQKNAKKLKPLSRTARSGLSQLSRRILRS